ncbi:MAG: MBL fold metallo-hydrolase [Hyphomicrobium sp. 32-62-53]|nr:MAG: MBL fold metallo-hydrolase [Hyphomicrobium sp. 12-62-95]OYX99559.1 MAG: MBL fold metallo-hydrolase [Hyphomicrobium sp. 32-62-53]
MAKNGKGEGKGPELVFAALGGLGEVGMNAYLYGIGPADNREWLIVDLGITFPEGEDDPGVDVILPDVRFLETQKAQIAGLIITHAHEDHIGAVLELWPRLQCPVYVTPFTAGMLKSKMADYGRGRDMPMKVVPLDSRFKAGSFDIELVSVAHSVPETSGVVLRTPLGTVYHTADWKIDATPYIGQPAEPARLAALGDEGVLALVCDSTNAMREGESPSETEVAASLAQIVANAPFRVVVTTFSSNVARIKACYEAARASGRKLVVAGRALHRVIQVAIETGYLPKDFMWSDQQQFKYMKREEVVLLCTGSQGEPRAAMAKIAEFEHPEVSLDKGDLVLFSSRAIPGNEKGIGHIQNSLVRMGCHILTDSDALIHVTGHPRRGELKQMYGWIRPKIVVPMHGEARHLMANADLARSLGVGEVVPAFNGEMVRLAPGPARKIDDVPVGRLFRDGNLLVPEGEGPVRERRKLAFVGIVVASVVLSRKGELVADPIVELDGVPIEDAEGESMLDLAYDALEGTLKSIPPARRRDPDLVEEALRKSLRAVINQAWGKKPICKVMVSVVDTR